MNEESLGSALSETHSSERKKLDRGPCSRKQMSDTRVRQLAYRADFDGFKCVYDEYRQRMSDVKASRAFSTVRPNDKGGTIICQSRFSLYEDRATLSTLSHLHSQSIPKFLHLVPISLKIIRSQLIPPPPPHLRLTLTPQPIYRHSMSRHLR